MVMNSQHSVQKFHKTNRASNFSFDCAVDSLNSRGGPNSKAGERFFIRNRPLFFSFLFFLKIPSGLLGQI